MTEGSYSRMLELASEALEAALGASAAPGRELSDVIGEFTKLLDATREELVERVESLTTRWQHPHLEERVRDLIRQRLYEELAGAVADWRAEWRDTAGSVP